MRDLTTTSYAILSQLSLRPWAAYELTKERERNVDYFWPRADSRIYAELKRLEQEGLAEGTTSANGRRKRTTYAITAAGRAALAAWMSGPPTKGVTLESEGLLRILNATDPEQVRVAVEAMRADIADLLVKVVLVGQEYVDGVAPFQDRVRWRSLTHDFLTSYAEMIEAWCARTEETLDARDGMDSEAIDAVAVEHIRERIERFLERPLQHRATSGRR